MCAIPGALILSFEPGLNAHAGVYAQKINTWSDLKIVCKQLKDPAVMEKFKCICFDTIEIAATLCQEFICQRAGVQALGDVPYGKLYKEYELEFSKTIRSITMLGYGAVFATHTEIKEVEIAPDTVVEQIRPKLDRRAFDIINSLVDVIGIGVMKFDENGKPHRLLYTNETPTIKAGNRFTYFPPVIEFSYQSILDNLSNAIEAEGINHNATILDKNAPTEIETLNYDEIRAEANNLWRRLVDKNPENAARILKKVEITFGRKIKLSEIEEDQVDLFNLVVLDMRDMCKEQGV